MTPHHRRTRYDAVVCKRESNGHCNDNPAKRGIDESEIVVNIFLESPKQKVINQGMKIDANGHF